MSWEENYLDGRVDVGVLLQSGRSGKCFTALGTSVSSSSDVRGADVSLKIGRIREDLGAVLARVTTTQTVLDYGVSGE